MLKDNIDAFDKKRIQEIAEIIYKTVTTSFQLVDDLLKWANLQRGSLKFSPKRIFLNDFVSQKIEALENIALKKNISIINNIENDLIITADENLLTTILQNLSNNAIKFSNHHKKIYILSKSTDKEIFISIQDEGIGIESDKIKKLFTFDQNISTHGTDKEKGTGLGLAICKEFVEKHGGTIFVKSKLNEGSTFTFTIPIV
ncbi:MAG: HAMP domain-containing histidine kinase [Bacteroidales bacterium]|nr:HAMP domain-containing histidine kinase [Bacteroidales bacterium]